METQAGRTEQYAGNNTGNDKIDDDVLIKNAKGQSGLLQFGSGTSEILDTAFKKETVGLVTREQYVEKRVNIRTKIEEEEKEKLQKLQQEEEELQLQKLKKRKVKANPKLSFSEDIENGEEEEEEYGEDTYSFSEREAEEQAERERLRKQWLREQEQIKNEALEITYSYRDGAGHRRVMQVRKGDTIGEFLRSVQQQLAPEFREIRTTSVENLLYVKEDLIIPHILHSSLGSLLRQTLHPNRKNQTIDEIMVCHCKPSYDGRMGCQDECLNRVLNIECVKGTCPCGDFCSNQQFQKHKYSN
ncbi:hypothetical protein LXL04_008709 [Taraxacum kok-saghyz]